MLTCQGFDVVTFNKVEESIAQYAANDSDVFCCPLDEILIYKCTHTHRHTSIIRNTANKSTSRGGRNDLPPQDGDWVKIGTTVCVILFGYIFFPTLFYAYITL